MSDFQPGALIRLRGLYPSLKTAVQKVADVILRQPEMAIYASVNELAAVARVSEATVMRFCRTLGFKGFQDFKIALAREMVTLAPALQEEAVQGADDTAVTRRVFQANLAALQDTLEVLEMNTLSQAAQVLLQSPRVLLLGAGDSGLAAAYARNRFLVLGLNAHYYPDFCLALTSAATLTAGDALLAISHSGSTRKLLEAVRVAQTAGARVIAITSNTLAPLARLSDQVLVTASREAGFREGTASFLCQILVIDSLSALMYQARSEEVEKNVAKIRTALTSET